MAIRLVSFFLAMILITSSWAHDTWVQTNTNIIRAKDGIHIDLMLGNHGNEHRDFKLASKIDVSGCVLKVHTPDGKTFDMKDRLTDVGYTPKEGFWSTRFGAVAPGMYTIEHSLDKVVNHGKPVRSIKSGKAFFVVSPSLDRVSMENPGFDKPLGHALELVPVKNPVTPMGPGQEMRVQLLFKGKPLAGERVSFVPRGYTLAKDFDEQYERRTDEKGIVTFTPTDGNYYLIVAHRSEPTEKSAAYDATSYSATLTVFVPDICPCCGE